MAEDDRQQRWQRLWQSQASDPIDEARLLARLHRYERRHRLQRWLEIALTVLLVGLVVRSLATGQATLILGLLGPFYAVFLPTVWWWSLTRDKSASQLLDRSLRRYCDERLEQLDRIWRRLRIYRLSALGLLAYAGTIMGLVSFDVLPKDWHGQAVFLLLVAVLWVLVTEVMVRSRQARLVEEQAQLREYQQALEPQQGR